MSMESDGVSDAPLRERIADNPEPAALWAGMGILLLLPEVGALLDLVVAILGVFVNLIPGDPGAGLVSDASSFTKSIPTLLDRDTIPNRGYWNGERWVNTFMGLEPADAWLVRVVAVYAYSALVLAWVWDGYRRFRRHYRYADWTPRDDVVDRLRDHTWGQFGMVVVAFFIVGAVFAPTIATTTMEENNIQPYSYSTKYWNEEAGQVSETKIGLANIRSSSQGTPNNNVGPMQYDDFGRFHPFGTTPQGKDLFSLMAVGSRISLTIGIASIAGAAFIAVFLGLVTAYYKGLADLFVVVTSDSIQALPLLMILILLSVVFQGTWLAAVYDGALLLTLIFMFTNWTFLWRSIRGPAFQTAEQEWVDAAKSYGQHPISIMRRHMAPYIIGYILVYGSMTMGGIIIATAGLSFLGLGITAPTPEWGRLINEGQQYVASSSWHISLIPGVLITLLVTGFNALGDGIRDAIDPQSEGAQSGEEGAAAGGGA